MFKSRFSIEDHLDLHHHASKVTNNESKWSFQLRFSLYQEACDYVKLQQREDIDFTSMISRFREHSKQQLKELLAKSPKGSYSQECCCTKKTQEIIGNMEEKLYKSQEDIKNLIAELVKTITK